MVSGRWLVGGALLSRGLLIPMEFGLCFAFEKLLDYNFGVQLLRRDREQAKVVVALGVLA